MLFLPWENWSSQNRSSRTVSAGPENTTHTNFGTLCLNLRNQSPTVKKYWSLVKEATPESPCSVWSAKVMLSGSHCMHIHKQSNICHYSADIATDFLYLLCLEFYILLKHTHKLNYTFKHKSTRTNKNDRMSNCIWLLYLIPYL